MRARAVVDNQSERRFACLEVFAGAEKRLRDFLAAAPGAVGAVQVFELAFAGKPPNAEMDAGHGLILGTTVVGLAGAADISDLAVAQQDAAAYTGPLNDLQKGTRQRHSSRSLTPY